MEPIRRSIWSSANSTGGGAGDGVTNGYSGTRLTFAGGEAVGNVSAQIVTKITVMVMQWRLTKVEVAGVCKQA